MCKLKKSFWCSFVVLVGLSFPMVFGEYVINGDFVDDVTGWDIFYEVDSGMGVIHDPIEGSGSAKLYLEPVTIGIGSNKHHFYQSFAVTPGMKYQISGKWKGDLNSGAGLGARGWVELQIGFGTGAVDEETVGSFWTVVYKKIYDGDNADEYMYVDETGAWDWDEITDAPENDNIPAADVGFEVPEGMTLMYLSFNIGVVDTDVITTTDDVKLWIDDLAIATCQGQPGDLNGDCRVTLADIALVAADWMTCNLDPQSACPF